MKHWPLRLKIALWSALVVALAQFVSALATAAHFYHEELEMLDQILSHEVRSIFDDLQRIPPNTSYGQQSLERLLPAGYRHRNIELRHEGAVVYRTPGADPEMFGPEKQPAGISTLNTLGSIRLAVAVKGPWQIRLALETHQARISVKELARGFLLASPLLLLITALGCWWTARKALRPVQAVTDAAQRITAEHLDQRLPVPPARDELQRLSLVLNRMIERLERSFHQARRFSADTSHELRTPLAVVHAGLEAMLSSKEVTPTQERQLLDLLDATTRLSTLSEKLLLLARADAAHLQLELAPVDLVAMLRESIEEAAIFAENSGIAIDAELPDSLRLPGDAARLMQVWRNLLENAVKYNRPAGRVSVELVAEAGLVHVTVTNTGPGLTDEQASHLFTRFYRAEPHRGTVGFGLGLSISREIVRAHGGELSLESHTPEHISFLVALPLGKAAPRTARRAEPSALQPTAS